MNLSLNGKRVLVTGAGRGLGRAIVESYVENGAIVFGLDVNQECLKQLKDSLPSVTILHVDLSQWDATKKAVESLGPLDILVNNAGMFIYQPILETTEETLDKVFSVNFKAAFNLSQVFARNVISNGIKGASIVNVSSAGGKIPAPTAIVYSTTKAALNMLTMGLGVELAPHGIRVNAVAPGAMPTPMMASLPPEVMETLAPMFQRTLIPGLVDLRDVASLVLYLSSDLAKAVTGSIYPIDNGFSFVGSSP